MMAESGPRKVSWLRRIGLAVLLLFLSLIVAHLIWTGTAQRKYWKRIDALKAAGQPTETVDFKRGDPASPDNAAHDIEAAVRVLTDIDSAVSDRFDRLSIALPLRPNEKQIIRDMQHHWAPAFKLMDRAMTQSRLEWDFEARPLTFMGGENGRSRELSAALAANVLWDHERGDDHLIAKHFDAIHLLSRYNSKYPSLVSHLMSVGMVELMGERVAEIAPDLKISATDPSAMSPSDARRIIDALLDEKRIWDSLTLALQGERVTGSQLTRVLADGTPLSTGAGTLRSSAGPQRYLIKPVLYQNGAQALDFFTKLIAMVPAANLPQLRASLPTIPKASVFNVFSTMTAPSTNRVLDTQFYALTNRRLVAVVLAIRWYATEHDGRRPMTLNELVPKYLPSVPVDPMSSSGEPIRYIGQAELPVVYSVGLNDVDDQGAETIAKTEPITSDDWRTLDHVVHLTRKPRPEPRHDDELEEPSLVSAGNAISDPANSAASRPSSAP